MKKYKFVKNDDGTYTIKDVEIFATGKHRGTDYNNQWGDDVVERMNALEANDYLPPVILGHNDFKDEKPSMAFLSNIRRKAKLFYADIVGVSQSLFEEIKEMKWPARSVELSRDKKRFAALALLGGSAPYFKFPNLRLKFSELNFSEEEGSEWLHFTMNEDGSIVWDKTVKEEVEHQGIINKIRETLRVFTNRINEIEWSKKISTKEVRKLLKEQFGQTDEALAAITTTQDGDDFAEGPGDDINDTDDEGGDMPTDLSKLTDEQFQEVTGMSRAEFAAMKQQNIDQARAGREAAVELFMEKKLPKNLAAGVRDRIKEVLTADADAELKFGERTVSRDEAFQEVLGDIFSAVADDTLLVPDSETGQKGNGHKSDASLRRFGENVTAEDIDNFDEYAAIVEIQNRDKCSFSEAVETYQREA